MKNKKIYSPPLPFLRPYVPPFQELAAPIQKILSSGMLTKGTVNDDYERAIGEYIGVKHVIATSSCTTGIILTLRAMNITGEVLVPAFTFCATANAVVLAGATPVFVDCLPGTYTMCPADAERKITKNTQAIMPVHVFGIPAEIDIFDKIAKNNNLILLFDSAHAMGTILNGRYVGTFGDAEIFSTTPTKTLITGEGGIITTNNSDLAQRIRILKEYGNSGDSNNPYVGLNGRITEIQCALGIASLFRIEESIIKREKLANKYQIILRKIPGIETQSVPVGVRTTWKDFSIIVDENIFGCNRDQLAIHLQNMGIPTRKYFYPALHKMKSFAHLWKEILPLSEKIAASILCLPMYPDLSLEDATKIGEAIYNIHNENQGSKNE